ncbi:Translocation and assembly module TamB [Serratia symbiotica]|nr:Translocation and assembly module TamB [Serratia symbiotica]
MNLIKKILLSFLSIFLLLICIITFFLSTKSGLHILINSAVHYIPGFHISNISGDWNNLILKDIKYQIPNITIVIKQFYLSVDKSCFKYGSLCFNNLIIHDIDIKFYIKNITLSQLSKKINIYSMYYNTPFPIIFRMITLNNIKININGSKIFLAEFQSKILWKERLLTFISTKIKSLLITLPKNNRNLKWIKISPIFKIFYTINLQIKNIIKKIIISEEKLLEENLQLLTKPLFIFLSKIYLPFNVIFKEIQGENFQLISDINFSINKIFLQGTIKNNKIQLYTCNIESSKNLFFIKGNIIFDDTYPVNITIKSILNFNLLKNQEIIINVNGELYKTLNITFHSFGLLDIKFYFKIHLNNINIPLTLILDIKELKLFFNKKLQYIVNNFHLYFYGKITNYKLFFYAKINGNYIPSIILIFNGNGNHKFFKLKRLRLNLLHGNIDIIGLLNWSKSITWNSEITFCNINNINQWLKWPIKLNGKLIINGKFHNNHWKLQIPILKLDGYIKNTKIKIYGILNGNSLQEWNIPIFILKIGCNEFNIIGKFNKKSLKFDMNINIPYLHDIISELNGIIKGSLQLRGNLYKPKFLIKLIVYNFKWKILNINQININGNFFYINQMYGKFIIYIKELKYYTLKFNLLILNIYGNELHHKIKLIINKGLFLGRVKLQGNFNYKNQYWHGDLNNTYFYTPIGVWYLTNKVSIDYFYNIKKINIFPYCWYNSNVKFCLIKTVILNKNSKFNLVLNYFNFKIINSILGKQIQIYGKFNIEININWKKNNILPNIKLLLIGKNIKIIHYINNVIFSVNFDTLVLNFQLNNYDLKIKWLIKNINNNNQSLGYIHIIDIYKNSNINGNIRIINMPLSIINPIFIKNNTAIGILNMNLYLKGTLKNSIILGYIILNNINIHGYKIPFKIINNYFFLKFNSKTLLLNSLIKTKNK